MGPRAGLDGRKVSSPPEFDPGPSSPQSVAIATELLGPQYWNVVLGINGDQIRWNVCVRNTVCITKNQTEQGCATYNGKE